MNERVTILLAADEDDVFLLNDAFHEAGWKTQFQLVQDGEQAIQYLEGKGPYANRALHPFPALAIVDMEMPKKSGFEVLAWTRAQENLKRLPIVILSCSAHGPHLHSAYELGTNSYLVKTQHFQSLLNRIKSLECWTSQNMVGTTSPEIRQNA